MPHFSLNLGSIEMLIEENLYVQIGNRENLLM
jgi:hypothetical protein